MDTSGAWVARELASLMSTRGNPHTMVSDNSSEQPPQLNKSQSYRKLLLS